MKLTIRHFVDFGNYLLSKERNENTEQKDVVSDADLANFFFKVNVDYTPDADADKSKH